MSLLDAQRWLDRRPDIEQPLYAVLAQLEYGDETIYRMVAVIEGKPALGTWLSHADWTGCAIARGLAEDLIGEPYRIKNKTYEVTRAFIVEKESGCCIDEEVDIDAPEPLAPPRNQM